MEKKVEEGTTMQTHFVSQWITSLAISVLCCSVLFIVFASYIVRLHETNSEMSVRIVMLEERQKNINSEMSYLRTRALAKLEKMDTIASVEAKNVELPAVVKKATNENGLELPAVPAEKDAAKNDLILSATGEVALPKDAMSIEEPKPEAVPMPAEDTKPSK